MKSPLIIHVLILLSGYCHAQQTPDLIPFYGKVQKFGYCDKNKRVVIPYKYDLASPFVEDMAAVAVGSGTQKWGFINSAGEEVVPLIYDYVTDFSGGVASVELNERLGIVNKKGKLIIPCMYEGMQTLSQGRIGMQIDNKLILYDTLGRIISTIHTFTVETPFSEERAVVKQNGKYSYIGLSGKIVIPFIYKNAYPFKEGFARVVRSDSSIFINKTGKRCFPYQAAGDFSEGFAAVFNGKYGFINRSGKLVIPFIYDDFQEGFNSGLVAVKREGLWGFIDSTGHVVIPFNYQQIKDGFREGFAAVRKNNIWGFVDTKGNLIVPCVYERVENFSSGMAVVHQNGKYGYINKEGKLVVACKYADGHCFKNGLAQVSLSRKNPDWTQIDCKGNEYWEGSTYRP